MTRLPTSSDFRCCGCGAASFDGVKPCQCATMVGYRQMASGSADYVVFMSPTTARRRVLSNLIKTRLLGVKPDDQDLILEDRDWMEIVAALEA